MANINFTGIKCPVCGVPFQEDDDIVVCPQCGAPYHRDCYTKEGQCIFTDLHQSGKEWTPPAPPKPPEASAEINDQECPVCGSLNAHSALFCNCCGAPLAKQPGQRPEGFPPPYSAYGAPQRGAYGPGPAPRSPYSHPFIFDPMGGVSPGETLDAGVSYGDASKLVKSNTVYYMPVFRYIKETGKNKFNFCAFLFSGAWLLYRKQYRSGIIVTGLMFLIYLAYLATSVFVATPVLLELMEQAGMDIAQGFAPTNEQMLVITQLISEEPGIYLKICMPMLCLLVLLAVMIFVGMRGNKMYLHHCVRMVRAVKSANLADYPNMTLDAKGGVNNSIAVCMFVCYFLLINVVPLLL